MGGNRVYKDYKEQRNAGVEEPIFDPDKIGIKNADLWKEINKERLEKSDALK